MDIRDIHTPVMLDRCVELLAPAIDRDGAVMVDATLGMGGSFRFDSLTLGLRCVRNGRTFLLCSHFPGEADFAA